MRRKGATLQLSNRQKEDHTYDRFLATASSIRVLRMPDAQIKAEKEKKAKAKKATKKK